jgi:hypothetical protein
MIDMYILAVPLENPTGLVYVMDGRVKFNSVLQQLSCIDSRLNSPVSMLAGFSEATTDFLVANEFGFINLIKFYIIETI